MLRPGASQPWKSWLSSGLPASRHLRNLLPCPRASWLRSLRHHSGSIGKGKDGIEVQGTSESKQAALDLLDKLFPPTRAPPDRVNRPINNNTPPSRHELGHGRSEDIDEPRRRLTIVQRLHDETSGSQEDRDFVLIMVNASLNLLPEDFRSLMPKGRHIEEWNLDQGDIVKIIPGRDPYTLDRIDVYYLFFKSPESAAVYQERAMRISRLAWTKAQNPEALPRQHQVDGENIDDLVKSYTLTPASQQLVLKRARTQMHVGKAVIDLVQHGGYPRLMALRQRANGRALVRLNLTGRNLTREQLFTAFRTHERHRNLAWSGTSHSSLKIRTLDLGHFATRGGLRDQAKKLQLDEDHANHDGLGGRRQARQCFLVEFEIDAQAQAFASFWHRRTLELPVKETQATKDSQRGSNGEYSLDYIEPTTLLEAEYLW